ncbi:DUF3644 domain-containing protein [Corynebacterium amycolatum]|uniref:DUF3644 domain-containing protein n=1 Tax=Corynebacterium amycolatum TaxID=43765 RepID=UPI000CB1E4F5|nr:DUF3644 domain-containing protein [Corynebacterium amycolatum]PLA34922.1 hypothetical protein CYJ42_10055 [Corynebacterium amycolatum]
MAKKKNYMPSQDELNFAERLVAKSQDSFQLGIELYNRPLLPNRVEACSMLLANAWELMLKSYIVKTQGLVKIYFSEDKDRTWALSDCVRYVFDNETDPIRRNLDELGRLRNNSVHYIVDEYDIIYGPVLQATVRNFAQKLEEFHDVLATETLPPRALILDVSGRTIDEQAIKEKYDPETANRFFQNYNRVQHLTEGDSKGKFAVTYRVDVQIVKKGANVKLAFDPRAEQSGVVLKQTRDTSALFPHRQMDALAILNNRVNKDGLNLMFKGKPVAKVNTAHWQNFVKAYDMKENPDMAFDRRLQQEKNPNFSYSQRAIDFVYELLVADPEGALDEAKRRVQKK